MNGNLGAWILAVAGASVISGVVLAMVPECRARRAVKCACAILVSLTMVTSAPGLSADTVSDEVQRYREDAQDYSAGVKDDNKRLLRLVMEEELSAYISDKANLYDGVQMQAEFSLSWDAEGWWYPTAVKVRTNADESVKSAVSSAIAEELGIPEDRQSWSTYG